jgi:hypothetical protein
MGIDSLKGQLTQAGRGVKEDAQKASRETEKSPATTTAVGHPRGRLSDEQGVAVHAVIKVLSH